jgi:ABC-type polysaccharide/polyol phosphate transport system ATPase subunit
MTSELGLETTAETATGSPEPGERIEPAIRCESLWKTFRIPVDRPATLKQFVLSPRRSSRSRALDALRDVSFDVRRGEFFGVIGANGSGKSTLLKCLAGIYPPDQGHVAVAGRISPFIELGVGFNSELPALDNVVVNATLLGLSPAEARRRFPAIIEFAELEDFTELKLKNYSSGMHVRLGFASAIQADADIYLVDEVLAVGDIRFQQKCFDTFRRLKREGRTVLFVSHDLATVERFCDRVLLLDRGSAVAVGEPSDIVQEYRGRAFLDQRTEANADGRLVRWGDGAAEILEARFEDEAGRPIKAAEQSAWVSIRSRVRFHRAMENPIFGVIVRTDRGDPVFATNTVTDGQRTGTFAPGDEVVYTVRFQVLLADGRYTASPSVAYEEGTPHADWREDLVELRVNAVVPTLGFVDLPHEAKLHAVEPEEA